jgi:hypothetical protein
MGTAKGSAMLVSMLTWATFQRSPLRSTKDPDAEQRMVVGFLQRRRQFLGGFSETNSPSQSEAEPRKLIQDSQESSVVSTKVSPKTVQS